MTNPTGNAELRECPFCSNTDLEVEHYQLISHVVCGCGARLTRSQIDNGIVTLEPNLAVEAWNRRTASGEGK